VHQYLSYLEQQGVECDVRPFVSREAYPLLYRKGHIARKLTVLAERTAARVADLFAAPEHDVFFVQREAFPLGPAWVEKYLSRLGRPIVFDFDDAIYLPRPQPWIDFVRRPSKTSSIVSLADQVIVSTEHLRGFAAAYNPNVWVIPTSVDTEGDYRPRAYSEHGMQAGPVRIGWIGSHSTARYFERLVPIISRVGAQFPIEVLVMGAGRDISIPGVRVENRPWSLETEADSFRSLDIGVYPLDDGVWEHGKGGFKAIQYMAAAVPCVVSPVGVVRDIVQDGEHGFYAADDAAWEQRLLQLIRDSALRRRMGEAGRRECEARFSVKHSAPKLLHVLEVAAARKR
jgi:glycosyltransferase involved in cell wall biosynthesis